MLKDGRVLMTIGVLLLAVQDGFSRHLAAEYPTIVIVTIRYWFLFVVMLFYAFATGGFTATFRSARPWLQALRGLFLALEICVLVTGFVLLGLSLAHAIFAMTPLIITAVAVPLLGERVVAAQWVLVAVGFGGVLLILRPGSEVFQVTALLPILAAVLFAAYSLTTRLVAGRDSPATSTAWTALVGVIVLTPVGLWMWEPLARADWPEMAYLAASSAVAHWLLIRAYAVETASKVQPFAYLQLVFASMIGVFWFGETLTTNLIIGAAIVVAAGLFSLRLGAEGAREV
ncbi:MAG: DMT family transporter [Pseudomonadota bacterium]